MPLVVEGYELTNISTPDITADRWSASLQAERDRIIISLARALGYQGSDVTEALNYLKNVDPDKFKTTIAGPASAGWAAFFGVEPNTGDKKAMASLKMQIKLAKAYKKWGERLSGAFDPQSGYWSDRVNSAKDYFSENLLSLRFVGDPPSTPIGIAPLVALYLTGGYVRSDLIPSVFTVNGQPMYAYKPEIANFIRPMIVAMIVQYGILARYALDAGLDDVANNLLATLKTALDDLTALKADNIQSITWAIDVVNHETLGQAIHIKVEVTEAAGG